MMDVVNLIIMKGIFLKELEEKTKKIIKKIVRIMSVFFRKLSFYMFERVFMNIM